MIRLPVLLRSSSWLLVVPPLLLATFLAASQLDNRAFHYDELATLWIVGGKTRTFHNLEQMLHTIAGLSQEQALGWPLLVSFWTRIFGWSEPALRALPLFAGLLAMAWTSRIGRELFAPAVGLVPVIVLATSGFFVGFMWFARTFTFVALCTTVLLWCYWRIMLDSRRHRPVHAVGMLLASVCLCYTHYFAILLLPAVALFHLLFAWRGPNRWLPPAILAIAGMSATLQLPYFLVGLEHSLGDANLKLSVMNTPEVLAQYLNYLGNNTLKFPTFSGWILLALLVGLVVAGVRQRHSRPVGPATFLVFIYAAAFLLALLANELTRVIAISRIRYLMPLWPLTALLIGLLVWRQRRHRFHVAEWLLAGMIVTGLHAINHPDLKYSFNYPTYRERMHVLHRAVANNIRPGDVLLAGESVAHWGSIRDFYVLSLPVPVFFPDQAEPGAMQTTIREHPRIWLIRTSSDGVAFSELAASLAGQMHFCETGDLKAIVRLELYARSAEDCPAAQEVAN